MGKQKPLYHEKILETEDIQISVSLGDYYRNGERFPTYWVEMDKLKGDEVVVKKMKAIAGKGGAIREGKKWAKEYLGLRNKLKRLFTGGDKVVYRKGNIKVTEVDDKGKARKGRSRQGSKRSASDLGAGIERGKGGRRHIRL